MIARYVLLLILSLLPWYTVAAPLNKFGSMAQQNMPVSVQQQALLPEQEKQSPTIRVYKQEKSHQVSKKKRKINIPVIFKIKALLAKLPAKKVHLWQRKFEKKRDNAMSKGKKSVVDYYERLIDLCKKSLTKRAIQ